MHNQNNDFVKDFFLQDKKIVSRIVDIDTGLSARDIFEGDTVRVYSDKQKISAASRDGLISINSGQAFIKVYIGTMLEVANVLTGPESMLMTYIMSKISYQSGLLSHINGRDLTRERMAVDTGQSVRTIDRILEGLIKKQVIGRHKTGRKVCYLANPYIFMRGNKINKTLYKLFNGTRWAKMLSDNGN